jgi:hypothetical protein
MQKLWERNDAPPHVAGAPGAGARPYLVLCHRPPEDDASGREAAPSDHDAEIEDGVPSEAHEDLDLDGGNRHRTAIVYQWVRIPR